MKVLFLLGCLFTTFGLSAIAADTDAKSGEGKKSAVVSKEEREKMASHHDKMAACLRSDRAVEECWAEMKKSCKESNGKMCPMMSGHKGHGKHKQESDKGDKKE